MFTFIFYIWGAFNALALLIVSLYDRTYYNSRTDDVKYFKEKTIYSLSANYSVFIWAFIGLFSVQYIWFIFYFIYIFSIRKLVDVNITNNPTRLNIEISRLVKLSIFLIVLFPVINHFFLGINVLQIILNFL